MSTTESPAFSSSGDAKAVAGTAAFSKFIAVLQIIADAETPPNIAKLVAASGYPRPTVHRIVAALQAEGLVAAVGGGNTFALGTRLVSLASRSWERSDLRIAAVDALMELRNTTSETVHLAVPSDGAMVYIEKLESPHAVHTMTGLDAIRGEIELTAQRGYAEDREENEQSIWCYGAAILGADGRAVGCISVSMPMFRREADAQRSYIEPLLAACRTIAARLGPASAR
jgi:IclR family transcriptional regulator, KDG regulon repressor